MHTEYKTRVRASSIDVPVFNGTHYVNNNTIITDHSDITKAGSLANLIDTIGDVNETTIEVPPGTYNLQGNTVVVPENINLKCNRGVLFTNGTLTINGSLEAGLYRVFDDDLVVSGLKEAEATWFGIIKDDLTVDNRPMLQAAVNASIRLHITGGNYRVVLINDAVMYQDYTWYQSGIFLKSNSIITLEPDTVIHVQETALDYVCIFKAYQVSNVIINGNGGILRGNNTTNIADTQHSHGIYIIGRDLLDGNPIGSTGITIKNLVLENHQGDGIDIGGTYINKNISIDNCTFRANSRQGITVGYVDGFNISNCTIYDTGTINGAAPKAGIDVEPNLGCTVINGVIANCKIYNNAGSGIVLYSNSPTTTVALITLENNNIDNNDGTAGIHLSGTITLNAITVKNNTTSNCVVGIFAGNFSTDLIIDGNISFNNTSSGFLCGAVDKIDLKNNISYDNGEHGYSLGESNLFYNNNVDNNIAYSNTLSGFSITASVCNITGNISKFNNQHGFFGDDIRFCHINNNIARDNGQLTTNQYSGFYIITSFHDNTFINNRNFFGSGTKATKYGLYIEAGSNNVIRDNILYGYTKAIWTLTPNDMITQVGESQQLHIGNVAAGEIYNLSMCINDCVNGALLTSVSVINAASISLDNTNYTSFTVQDKGVDGSETITITSAGTNGGGLEITAYKKATLPIALAWLEKGTVIRMVKNDYGSGKAFTGLTLILEYLTY